MSEKDFFSGSHNPINWFRSAAYSLAFLRANPDYFEPDGIWCFCGAQGQGKTLSAVQTLLKLHAAYPHAVIVSNMAISGVDTVPFTDYDQIASTTNGLKGVIFFLDEAQSIWNCLEARGIPIEELATLCQNRKDRRVVIFTSQVYGRVAKQIREQYKYVVLCRKVLKFIQFNTVVNPVVDGYTSEDDGHFQGEIIKHSIFFHSPDAYKAYDTLNKIERFERKKKMLRASSEEVYF